MKESDARSLMFEVLSTVQEINRVAVTIIPKEHGAFFKEHSLPIPVFTCSELGFLRTVSWFYVLYYELGNINVEFLVDRFSAYQLDESKNISKHLTIVQHMRTFLQHYLDIHKDRNLRIQDECECWFEEKCKTRVPSENDHWENCLLIFLKEAILFLATLKNCLRKIELDETRDQIVNTWSFQLSRYHSPHEFDSLISIVASDMGRDNIDAIRLRKRYYDKWTKELQLYQGKYDFAVEGRKLIEHALLVETISVPPITGKDLLEEFSLEPGPKIGELLKEAYNLYKAEPCSRQILLQKLRQKLS